MIDWGLGHYERTAVELEPVAEHVVSLAGIARGQRVLDLATGTGNAALLAARSGAAVTGLDASARLLEVARGRAAAEGLDVEFVQGDLHALPFDDGSFDVVVSVFGLIFATDAERAFAELMRVLEPDGRALVSVWMPAGPIDAMVGTLGRALAEATGMRRARFAWHDGAAVSELAAGRAASVEIHDGELSITAASPEDYFAANEALHPMSLAGRPVLEQAGTYAEARELALAALREGNEDPDSFRVTSPYRVIEIRHQTASRENAHFY